MIAKRIEDLKDGLLLAAEWSSRHIYWRSPWLRSWVKRRRQRVPPTPQTADRQELKEYLKRIGVEEGALVMAHTSVTGVQLTSGAAAGQPRKKPLDVACCLLQDLLDLVGDSGTLVMPTHASYQGVEDATRTGPPVYDPASTPCAVGLANELFWRRTDVQRSLFPFNMLAARGPLAEELLRDNLNESKPLPHGIHSGYYRFCQKNGLVVSIGVPLGRHLTLLHTGEEVRDAQWPIKDFFEEREYVVVRDGERKTVVVRQTRPEFLMYSICTQKLHRDIHRAGILHKGMVGSVRVDWARSKEVFDFIMARNQHSTYPFYLPQLARRWSKRA